MTLRIMRFHALRSLSSLESGGVDRASAIHKLFWANFHRELGELAVDVLGAAGMVAGDADVTADTDEYQLSTPQRLFLYSRADTIYGGSNQIQRNVIGERALGLPKEPS